MAATLLCLFGFGYAANQIIFPKPAAPDAAGPAGAPQAEKPKQDAWDAKAKIQIVALGDSLTVGTGDLTGKGYVGRTRDLLEKQLGKPVFVYNNFAIAGYRTYDLLKDWDAKKDIGKSIAEADLVLLTIGGNDLFEGGGDIFTNSATGEGFNPKAAADRMPEALKRLSDIFDRIAKANPKARVLYVGLYHPFLDLDPQRTGAPIVQQWNKSAFDLANRYPNFVVVPTYDLFELGLSKYLYTDHFHPNQDGYARIAGRIAEILN